jgi:predicted nucleic acid-binding protein
VAAVARYLADTSALDRIGKPPVYERLQPLVDRGLIATCGITELEMLYSSRNAAEYQRLEQQFALRFESLAMPDEVWQMARDAQRTLASRGAHRGVPLPDLLVAATAARHGVTVLHYDHDFDVIAEVTGQKTEWVVPPGSAD